MPKIVSVEARSLLVALLHRNPAKRLGSGPDDAEEIKGHPFFTGVDWQQVFERKLPVPPVPIKRVINQDIPFEKVYGASAFDESKKNFQRVQEWSYIRK
jgi:hypothetical protein